MEASEKETPCFFRFSEALASSHSKVKLIPENIRGFAKAGKASNAALQRRARTAASDKSCMREMLIARPLQALVILPFD